MTKDYQKDCPSLFFDMDGTLWDGVTAYANGFNDYFAKHDIDRHLVADDIKRFMGLEEQQYLAEVLPSLEPSARSEAYQEVVELQYGRILLGEGFLYDDVSEGLESLSKHYNLFVVSNCPKYTIQYFLKWSGLEHLFIDTMAHGQNHQPKHQNIRLLKDRYEITDAFYVGDTDSDRKQSELVPMPFVYVDYGFGDCGVYDFRFHSFNALSKSFLSKV